MNKAPQAWGKRPVKAAQGHFCALTLLILLSTFTRRFGGSPYRCTDGHVAPSSRGRTAGPACPSPTGSRAVRSGVF